LNDYQKAAWIHVLDNPISYIWGPPGCGKTRTLGEVVRTTFEAKKRALLCSNTNKAVDQVLLSICRALGTELPPVWWTPHTLCTRCLPWPRQRFRTDRSGTRPSSVSSWSSCTGRAGGSQISPASLGCPNGRHQLLGEAGRSRRWPR